MRGSKLESAASVPIRSVDSGLFDSFYSFSLLIFAVESAEEGKWLRARVHAPVFIIDGKEVSK